LGRKQKDNEPKKGGQIFGKLDEKEPERWRTTEQCLWKNERTWYATNFGKLREFTGTSVGEIKLLEEIIYNHNSDNNFGRNVTRSITDSKKGKKIQQFSLAGFVT
jgi:hypothetical protein